MAPGHRRLYLYNISKCGSNGRETKWHNVRGSGLFLVPGSQVVADGGCERDVVHKMNKGNRAWGALKSVQISNIRLRIQAK